MANSRVVYPGTFDPVTNGHLDLIKRASGLFAELIVAVATNPLKAPTFTLEQRVQFVEHACSDFANVRVQSFDCLLTDFASQVDANVVIRGLRALTDFEYEIQLANMNRQMKPDFETLFLTPDESVANISSSLVREIAYHGGDVSRFVPAAVCQAMKAKYLKS